LSLVSGSDSPRGAANAIGGVDGTDDATRVTGGSDLTETLAPEPPDVVGENVADAEKQLDQAGFEVVEVSQFSHSPSGTVLEQEEPITGESAGTLSVLLVVAEPFPRIPGIVGLSLATAREELRAGEFSIGTFARCIRTTFPRAM
jgi:PASTA domain